LFAVAFSNSTWLVIAGVEVVALNKITSPTHVHEAMDDSRIALSILFRPPGRTEMRQNASSIAAEQRIPDVLSIETDRHSAQKPPPEFPDEQFENRQPTTLSVN
jgi:hypothetical protein